MLEMLIIMLGVLIISMLLGIPMALGMVSGGLIALITQVPNIELSMAVQQLYVGISSYTLLAIPMFMLCADIMCSGQCAGRLLNLVKVFLGHIPGGVAVTAIGACTLFGSLSGSTQATFVAIGKPMYREMKQLGYDDSHSLGMLMNAANIALLIPPSICMIIFCVVANASVAELFIAGIGPGILLFLLFSAYEVFYAKKNNIERAEKAVKGEIIAAIKEAIIPLGTPVIILGGIYSGKFSPTEAAAVSVLYAYLVEKFVYKTITMKKLAKILIGIGQVTATVFVLVSAGQVLSWILTFGGAPQAMYRFVIGMGLSPSMFLFFVSGVMFVCCMFSASEPIIYILAPIFYPIALSMGIDIIHLGVIMVLQAAVGCVTPPFGCNLFTAVAIFDKPYVTVVRKLWPYLTIIVIATIILIIFPEVALLLRNLAF